MGTRPRIELAGPSAKIHSQACLIYSLHSLLTSPSYLRTLHLKFCPITASLPLSTSIKMPFRWDDFSERRLLLLIAEKSSTPTGIWQEIADVMSNGLTASAVKYSLLTSHFPTSITPSERTVEADSYQSKVPEIEEGGGDYPECRYHHANNASTESQQQFKEWGQT